MVDQNTLKRFEALGLTPQKIIEDYRLGFMSRQASLLGRKEVLTGKAKFGIFGDGKEVAQLAMARAFQPGDWRSGYYRDQTFAFAVGAASIEQFFAQLYADTNLNHEPASAGRQMNSHFASRYIDDRGHWKNQLIQANNSADLSPTAAQMARVVGLAYASKLYRQVPELKSFTQFSIEGQEVAFATIGNASTSEGVFWEAVNAAGVLQIPLALSVWDDGYGISVPNRFQTTKESISKALAGFQATQDEAGFEIYVAQGWDYLNLCEVYQNGVEKIRRHHAPALFHIIEMTQPQGHSTSGSHERYKSKDRLTYEASIDCLAKMRQWMIDLEMTTEKAITDLEEEAQGAVEAIRKKAWDDYCVPIEAWRNKATNLMRQLDPDQNLGLAQRADRLDQSPALFRKTIHRALKEALLEGKQNPDHLHALNALMDDLVDENRQLYQSHLHVENPDRSPLSRREVDPTYDPKPKKIDGRQIIQRFFDESMAKDPRIFIIGEDIGKLGGVNLEFDGLADKHGELRVTDTGIREATILGQGIGAAMRGLRPIVDIQYLDYLLYAFQVASDDLATLHYRTAGGQAAPVIIRTKGHRLEGIWHTGSPLGVIINGLRGIHVCVPRNMTQAAGMYRTLLAGDDPGLVIEVLNRYRVKEPLPTNLDQIQVALGTPEILQQGSDLTLVTYGACIQVAEDACQLAGQAGINVELIDVRTLLPFDRPGIIAESIEKTGAVLFLDEDVPGGASAYMLQQVLDRDRAYGFLDAPPKTLSARPHRSAYATDGDYYSKPNALDVFDEIYRLMADRQPGKFNRWKDFGVSLPDSRGS